MKVYDSISDCINKIRFDCIVYDGSCERIPYYYRRYPDRAPLYEQEGGPARAVFTIAQMSHHFSRGATFTISKKEDVLLILDYCDRYLILTQGVLEIEDKSDPDVLFYTTLESFNKFLLLNKDRLLAAVNKEIGVPTKPKSVHGLLSRLSGTGL